jgi:hypothetical protein
MNQSIEAFGWNPFPGLRPFNDNEDFLFFGRDGQISEVLRRLKGARFLAVVGSSGSGKSSLIRAGLIPSLHRGAMTSAGSNWEVIYTRPGGAPIGNLARSLAESDLYEIDKDEDTYAKLYTLLNRSRGGLTESIRLSNIEPATNVLIVVDQFEELFRYRDQDEKSLIEAADYVGLLLEAASEDRSRIHIVLTMRSDFLGDCANFTGLAEAVNRGEYLIPKLNREELESAIVNPIHVAGGKISNRLVQRLLNCVSGNQDQLPILQHALMRTWQCWEKDLTSEEPIDLEHFQEAGEIEHAISRHATEIIRNFNSRQLLLTERVFKALTELGNDRREVRRPVKYKNLMSIVDCSETELFTIIDAFRGKQCAFLTPTEGAILYPDSVIDISHESLMRVWDMLRKWVQEENQSARIYRRLAETAVLNLEGKSGLYRDPDLQIALAWQEQTATNEAWAKRYHDAYVLSMSFLDQSRKSKENETLEQEELRRIELDRAQALAELQTKRAADASLAARKSRIMSLIMASLTLAALATGFYARVQQNRLKEFLRQKIAQNAELQVARDKAKENELIAGRQTQLAVETSSFFVDELIENEEAGLDPESLKLRVLDYLVEKNRKIRQIDSPTDEISASETIAELGIARSLIRLLGGNFEDKKGTTSQREYTSPGNDSRNELEVRETISGLIQKSHDERISGSYQKGTTSTDSQMKLQSALWFDAVIERSDQLLRKRKSPQLDSISLREKIRIRTLLADVFQGLGRYEAAKEQRDTLANDIKAYSASPNLSVEDRIEALNYSLRSDIALSQIDEKEFRWKDAVKRYQQAIDRGQQAIDESNFPNSRETDEIRSLIAEALHEMGRIVTKDGAPTKSAILFERSNRIISEISRKNKTSGMIRITADNYRYLADLFALTNPDQSEQYRLKTEELLNLGIDKKQLERTVKDRSRRAWLMIDRGDALETNSNSFDERLSYYKKAVEMFSENLLQMPNSRDAKRDISTGHERIGIVYLSKRPFPTDADLEMAKKEFQEMLVFKRELALNYDDWESKLELAITYSHLCDWAEAKGDIDNALNYYQMQKEILDKLFEMYPSEFSIARNRLLMYWGISNLFQMKSQIQESLQAAYACRETVKTIGLNLNRAPFVTRMKKSVESRILDLEAILSSEKNPAEIMQFPKRQRQLAISSRLKLLEERRDLNGAIELVKAIESHSINSKEDQVALLICNLSVANISSWIEKESSETGLYEIHVRSLEKSYELAMEALQSGALDLLTLRNSEDFSTLRQGDRWDALCSPSANYRAYAESVINYGGYVGVIHDNGFQDNIDTLEKLPEKIYSIFNVNLVGHKSVDDRLLEPLPTLVGLRTIMLERVPGLRNDQLAFLKGCNALQVVGLGGNSQIDGSGLKHLVELPELRVLYFGSTNFDTKMAESISGLGSLNLLDINTSLISDDALISIAKIKSLRDLCLTNNAITDSGIQHLKGMDIETLRLNETDVSDGCIDSLLELKSLKVLDLDSCSITDSGVSKLVEIPNLQMLNMNNLNVSLEAMSKLAELYELQDLKIHGVSLTPEEINELKSRLPFCKVDPDTIRFSERKAHNRKSAPSNPSVK